MSTNINVGTVLASDTNKSVVITTVGFSDNVYSCRLPDNRVEVCMLDELMNNWHYKPHTKG